MVVVGVVVERGQDQRIDAGNPSLTAVAASYDIAVEQSLKGDAEGTLTLTKIVGYDVSGEESDTKEAYSVDIDSANSIKVGSRYVLAVIQSDGRWYATAEPFRFRLEGGEAVAESGMLEDAFLEDRFPARSETDLISDVESIVAAQAAEAAAR